MMSYDKVYGYYSMWNVRNNINKSKKYWEYPKVDRICIVNKHNTMYKSIKILKIIISQILKEME